MSITRRQFLQSTAVTAGVTVSTPYFFSRAAQAADTVEVGVLWLFAN